MTPGLRERAESVLRDCCENADFVIWAWHRLAPMFAEVEAAERERCAKVAQNWLPSIGNSQERGAAQVEAARQIASAIRAQNKEKP